MTGIDSPYRRRRARRMAGLTISLILVACAWWYSRTLETGPSGIQQTQSAPPALPGSPASYPTPGKEPAIRTEFPAGVRALSGTEIVAALSDHTALLDGGFVEYYAPDGKLRGMVEGKHYGGSWAVRNGAFCTLLQDSSDSVCSPVGRAGDTLYWSEDGGKEASPVSTMPGNVRGLN